MRSRTQHDDERKRRERERSAKETNPQRDGGNALSPGEDAGERVRTGEYVLPGGRIDAEAIRAAVEAARAKRSDAGEGAEAASDDDELRTVVFEIRRDLNKRLDKYLTDRISFMSRNQLQRLIERGGVTVNDKVPKASTLLHAGDVVEVVVPEPPSPNIQPEDIPLDVLFEDEHLVVLNKQPDIIVHPARSHLKGTMLSALAFHFKFRSKVGGDLSKVGHELARPGVVHRLDRHTSGCIVFAKTEEAHWKLGRQFEHRQVDKRYLAVVRGRIEPAGDVIELPLGPHPSRERGYREKYVVRHDELGKNAVTIYRVRERYATPIGDFTLVELELKTGRTHQIRVHLSHNDWPIVADDMYGGKALGVASAGAAIKHASRGTGVPPVLPVPGGASSLVEWNAEGMGPQAKLPPEGVETVINRQALHACVLGFRHPVTEAPMRFVAPLRGDLELLVRTLRTHSSGGELVETPGATVDVRALLAD